MRRVAQLFVVFLVVSAPHVGASQEWNVTADQRREAKLAQRYERLFLERPREGYALTGLLDTIGTGGKLSRLIDRLDRRAVNTPDDPRLWLALGHLRWARGDTTVALSDFRRAVTLAPASVHARIGFGEALRKSGQLDAANAEYEAALAAASARTRREILRQLADIALAASRDDDAIGWLNRLVEIQPSDIDLRVELGEALARAESLEAAIAQFEAALALVGRNGKRRAELLRDVGGLHLRRSRPQEAVKSFREALALTSGDSWVRHEIYARLIEAHRDLGRVDQIYAELRREWSNPGYSDALTLANLAEELGLEADTIRWLRVAISRDSKALEPRSRLILRLSRQGKTDEVDRLYREVFRLEPDRLAHRIDFANWLFFSQRRPSEAMDLLVELEKRAGDDVADLVAVAEAWQRFGLAHRSLTVLERLSDAHPRDVVVIEALGDLQAKVGRVDEARATWLRLLDADVEPLAAHLRIAGRLQAVRDWDGVIANLEWAVRLAPDAPEIHRRLAHAYESARRWGDAIAMWEKLYVERDAIFAGERLIQLARFTDVSALLARWETRRIQNPSLATTLFVARLRHASGGRFTGWLELVEEIVAADPAKLGSRREEWAWIAAVKLLAEERERDGAYLEAATTWMRLGRAFGREKTRAYRRVATLSWSLDADTQEAMLEEALAAAPDDPDIQTHAGYFWSERGDVARGIVHLSRAIELAPRGFDVHFELARLLVGANERRQARDVLLRVVAEDWSGVRASAAALSALDLAESDDELLELELLLRRLGPRVSEGAFRTMMVAVYNELFVYSTDPDRAFRSIGEAALPILVSAMQSPHEDETERAAALLRLYPDEAVVAAARVAWRDRGEFNEAMLIVLARTRLPQAAPLLLEAVRSEDPTIARRALAALRWTPDRSSAAPLLRIARYDRDAEQRSLALAALACVPGADVVAELIAATESSRPLNVRRTAVSALGLRREKAAVDRLDELLSDSSAEVSMTAAWSLATMRTEASARSLFASWWSEETARRHAAGEGLRAFLQMRATVLAADGAEYLTSPPGVRLATSPRNAVIDTIAEMRRAAALVASERLEVDDARGLVLEDLVAIAEHEADTEERHEALRSLIVQLRPRLREIVRTADGSTLLGASMLLPRARKSEDIPLVLQATRRLEADVRPQVIDQLADVEWKSLRAEILAAARTGDAATRAAAVDTIVASPGAHHDATARAVILDLTRDNEADVRSAAVVALGHIGGDGAIDALVERFEGGDFKARLESVEALRRIDSPRARDVVKRLDIVNHTAPCSGDSTDLTELLRDDCVEMLGAGF